MSTCNAFEIQVDCNFHHIRSDDRRRSICGACPNYFLRLLPILFDLQGFQW